VPEGIEDLLWDESLEPGSKLTFADVNKDLIESYRRAQLDAAENLCGPVTDEEWIENRIIPTRDNPAGTMYRQEIDVVLAARKAKYFPASKEKTPEERVTVMHAGGKSIVYLDHEWQRTFGDEDANIRERDAERYRQGLIGELRAQQEGSRK